MRAIILKGFGDLDSLVIEELPDPKPQKGHALIGVKAFEIHYSP
jgi:NADPH:quinone reductase-like Zn-dependent oxidoreductase